MADFATVYQRYVQAAGHTIPDPEVGRLPHVAWNHPRNMAWKQKSMAYERLANRIRLIPKFLRILDLGCGNGWMAARLSHLAKTEVLGVDIADFQIQQALRVYGGKPDLDYARADVFRDPLPYSAYSMIVLADALPYFPDLGLLISQLKELLLPGGEIYLMGEEFYLLDEIPALRDKKFAEFEALGVPEMQAFFHFHSVEELTVLGGNCMFNPKPQTGGFASMLRRAGRETYYAWAIKRDA